MSAYLVQYGRSAFVGRFTCDPPLDLSRGGRVVVRTPRGLELGDVLGPAVDRFAATIDPSAGGDLIRPATSDDAANAELGETVARQLLANAELRATTSGLPVTVIDAEPLLDGSVVILHILPWAAFDGDAFVDSLAAGVTVRLHDVSRTPTRTDPPTTCGKPGCGTSEGGCSSCGTGGGCSTGSCSKGSVKSADELTAYFADLRAKMAAAGRTSLH